jgi:hypothetical protein
MKRLGSVTTCSAETAQPRRRATARFAPAAHRQQWARDCQSRQPRPSKCAAPPFPTSQTESGRPPQNAAGSAIGGDASDQARPWKWNSLLAVATHASSLAETQNARGSDHAGAGITTDQPRASIWAKPLASSPHKIPFSSSTLREAGPAGARVQPLVRLMMHTELARHTSSGSEEPSTPQSSPRVAPPS